MSVSIPSLMQAMVLTRHGGYDALAFTHEFPTPSAHRDEVVIEVHACGLNNTDINTRTAWYSKGVTSSTVGGKQEDASDSDASWGGVPIHFPRIQGADVCGTVVALGEGADPSLLGKRVMIDTWLRDWSRPHDLTSTGYFGSELDGGFAQFTKVHQNNVHPIDSTLSHAEIATFATACITAENMLERAQVAADDTVLVTGASGGVGSALIQLAHRRGATVVALCSDSKRAPVCALNPAVVLSRSPENLSDALQESLGERTVSVVADVVGGELFSQLIAVLRRGGRYTCAGAIAGPMVPFDLRVFYLNDLTFLGATVAPVGLFAKLVTYIEQGHVKPLLAKRFALKDLVEAQKMFVAKEHLGNIVVEP